MVCAAAGAAVLVGAVHAQPVVGAGYARAEAARDVPLVAAAALAVEGLGPKLAARDAGAEAGALRLGDARRLEADEEGGARRARAGQGGGNGEQGGKGHRAEAHVGLPERVLALPTTRG